MVTLTIEELYEQHIASRSIEEQLRLVQIIAQKLSEQAKEAPKPQRSIMELHGLGHEIWEGVDAQEYVNQLRDEWDRDDTAT
ncbi:hypothetical protein HRbin16_00653 [bacterium HR16]|nr:hypothetical protein HRbin16_00653 [bacterium HR16]